MIISKMRATALALSLGAGLSLVSAPASAAQVWLRNSTIIGVAETDGLIEVQIQTNSGVNWFSMAASAAGASRFLSAATSAYLSGKRIDVKLDFAGTGCGTTQADCETALGWLIHN
jgi:hypothetical protein